MNFDEYCQQKSGSPGSGTYYVLKRAPIAHQPLLSALFALRQEFEESVKEVSDPAIGRTKLAWWQKEMAALAEGSPTHPVSLALAAHSDGSQTIYPALQTWLAGYAMDFEQARYPDYAHLQRYLRQVGGTFATLVARVTAHEPDLAGNWAAASGEALMLAQFVEELGSDARRGRIYLPIDEMQRFNVTAADLINRRYSDAFNALMQFQATRARDALFAARDAFPAEEQKRQGVLRAQIALALALLDEIERDGYRVLHQRVALTPIRKLWITWRSSSSFWR
ncbi:squalene/phytoene synthase family protein [Paraburkholderia hayleyella]|uniref:squalene/phytoene synthase family protein n=1 Tax=Paraburkholderia hayleyella TaxID=2152889 RepID=UPI0012923CA8|nr:squalene/phytoene synthase family protein [Paraburkholderia hayleyella]